MKEIIVDAVIVVFPIFIYFFTSINNKILEAKNNLCFEFCVFSSIYLLLNTSNNLVLSLYLNSFLILFYYKKNNIFIILMSILTLVFNTYLNINNIILIIPYIIYYIMYKKDLKYLSYFITIINSIIFLITNNINLFNISIVISFIILNEVLIKIMKKLDNTFKLYKTLDDIHNDKLISSSLFKITHEIKNPLAVCKGYLDMYDSNNIDHSKRYIPIIKEEIDRTLILLNDFLSMSKLSINKDIIDINMLLEQVLENLNILFKKNNIKIKSNIDNNEIYINADYNRLTQVFVNILKNSIESIEKNGLIELTNYIEKNNIVIKIKDNGIGIKDIEKIKEPFFTTKLNGTGLGVPLSIEIIKKHNGTIDYSSDNSGTTVTVKLPIICFDN